MGARCKLPSEKGRMMSDTVVKIIPTDPYRRIDGQEIQRVMAYLQSKIKADKLEVVSNETPLFIDCGDSLETIQCPYCGETLDFDWWHGRMDAAYGTAFRNLSVKLPCCGRESSLNDLAYDFPCGFSCDAFHILNPWAELREEDLKQIQELLGISVRAVYAHI